MADQKLTALATFTPILTDVLYGVDDPGGTPISGGVILTALNTLLAANLVFPNTGLKVQDTNASHNLIIKPGSDLSASDKTLTITTGNANRGFTILGDLVFNVGLTVNTNAGIIDFTAASKTLTVEENSLVNQDLTSDASPTFANIDIATAGAIRAAVGAGNTLLIQARDVDGAAYTTFITLTSNNTPTMDLGASTRSGEINYQDNVLKRPVLVDYAEETNTVASSSNVITLDLATGNNFETVLTENITTINMTNPPASGKVGSFTWRITQDSSARTLTFAAAVKWAGDDAPDVSTVDSLHLLVFSTFDGGTTWIGAHAVSEYS